MKARQGSNRARALQPADARSRRCFRVGDAQPDWVARPASSDRLAAVVSQAAARGLNVVPFGAGRQQTLGAPPQPYDVALVTRDLNKLVAYEPADMTVTAQAGMRFNSLQRRLAVHGQWLPVLPWGDGAQSLGGLVAAAVPGPFAHRYGLMRDLVLGLEVVGADGAVSRPGGRVVKNVAGYELCKLHSGALGSLGILTSITFRVFPLPKVQGAWTLALTDASEVVPLAEAAGELALTPIFCEWLAGRTLQRARPQGPQAAGGWFVCGFGGTRADVEAAMERLDQAAAGLGVEGERRAGWPQVLTPIMRGHAPQDPLSLRLGLRPARLVSVVTELLGHPEAAPERVAAHVGLGVVRLGYGARTPAAKAAALEAVQGLLAAGEYLVLEAGAVAGGRWWFPARSDETIMAGLKEALDPQRVLNAGRFLPQDPQ